MMNLARLAVLLALVGLTGCRSLIQGMLFGISERTAKRKVKVFVPEADQGFRAMRAQPGRRLAGGIPPGFRAFVRSGRPFAARAESAAVRQRDVDRTEIALVALEDETANDLFKAADGVIAAGAAGRGAAQAPLRMPSSRRGWTTLRRRLEDAALTDAWSALVDASTAYEASLATARASRADIAAARGLRRKAYYVREYVKAYFTGVALVQVKVDLSEHTRELETRIKKRLRKLDPEMDPDELVRETKRLLAIELKHALKRLLRRSDLGDLDRIVDDLVAGRPTRVWGYTLARDEDGAVGFTSRAGETFKWPTIEVTIDPSESDVVSWSDIDAKAIGFQLLRVFIEGIMDAGLRVPGVPNATAVGFPDAVRLPKFEAVADGQPGVTAEEFNLVNDWGARAEGVVGSGIGQIIRGIGWISLNNEALAGLIETAVGVTIRKLVEAALWERYADADADTEDVLAARRGRFVEIEFEFHDLARPADDHTE